MKGYAKVTVNTGHREKIADLIEKIEVDSQAIKEKYLSIRKEDKGLLFSLSRSKREKVSKRLKVFEREQNMLSRHYPLTLIFKGELLLVDNIKGSSIRKISHLSTKDEILLDDELMAVWNEYIEAKQ